jgi:formylglycine-generating enzyme required for sulfatase activity/predicted Ser/Thr protein kinase
MDRHSPFQVYVGRSDRTTDGSPRPLAGRYPFLTPSDNPNDLGRLGRYRVVAFLGEGGMGFVFRAEDDGLQRPVALKVMRPEIADLPTARERFLREGRAAAAIKSDHVITIHDVGEENGVVFLAMEFLAGENLDDWLKAQPTPVPGKAVVRVAKHILKGLAAAHEKGLIHRDIKPANLWVETGTKRIKLLDFGLTRLADTEQDLTGPGQVLGTPTYMAPEQARGERVDGRADLFSVGVVLYRMITGKSPFVRDERMAVLFAVTFNPVPTVASLGVDIPDDLGRLIDQLLAKGADDRPQSAEAALAVVTEVERQLRADQAAPPTATRPDGPQSPPPGQERVQNDPTPRSGSAARVLPHEVETDLVPVRKSNVKWILAGIAATVLLVLLVVFVVSHKSKPTAPPSEVMEPFVFVVDGVDKKEMRSVLTLDIGGGEKMEFVRINEGTFWMGAPDGEEEAKDDEKPQREVEFDRGFYLGKYEVTQAEYKAVTGETPSHFKGNRLPVEQVSWEDANEFCKTLSDLIKRKAVLPSEAQWEYACRAGTKTPFHFGSKLNGDLANCDGRFPYPMGTTKGVNKDTTVEVGSYPANPWGLHDMHGNVSEWCQDSYGPYDKVESKRNPLRLAVKADERLVLRGGSWGHEPRVCRASSRALDSPKGRQRFVGFRVCLPLD